MMTKVLFVNERKSGAKSLHESASSFEINLIFHIWKHFEINSFSTFEITKGILNTGLKKNIYIHIIPC